MNEATAEPETGAAAGAAAVGADDDETARAALTVGSGDLGLAGAAVVGTGAGGIVVVGATTVVLVVVVGSALKALSLDLEAVASGSLRAAARGGSSDEGETPLAELKWATGTEEVRVAINKVEKRNKWVRRIPYMAELLIEDNRGHVGHLYATQNNSIAPVRRTI